MVLAHCGEIPEAAGRVLRGGAFNNNQRNVRSAVRNDNNPDNRNNNVGFRVCVCPHWPPEMQVGFKALLPRLMAEYFPSRVRKNRANSNRPIPCLSGLGLFYMVSTQPNVGWVRRAHLTISSEPRRMSAS